jgi:hypothetical protein
VAKKELNLLQFAAGGTAEASATSTVMPHAALPPLCRMPDYAEPLVLTAIWREFRLNGNPEYSA